jgi:hypothetical protein
MTAYAEGPEFAACVGSAGMEMQRRRRRHRRMPLPAAHGWRMAGLQSCSHRVPHRSQYYMHIPVRVGRPRGPLF